MSRGFAKFAAILSCLQALLYIILVLTLLALNYKQNQFYFIILSTSFIIISFIGFIAVAPATAQIFFAEAADWSMMGKNIALLCLSVTMIYFSWLLLNTHQQVAQTLDLLRIFQWVAWFTFGGLGLWVVIVAWINFITQKLPRNFILPCIIKSFGFWLILIGVLKGDVIVAQVGVIMGALIGGPWYHGLLGYYLWNLD